MKRRDFIKGLVALPVVLSIPNVLLPKEDVPLKLEYISTIHEANVRIKGLPSPGWRKLNEGITPNKGSLNNVEDVGDISDIAEIIEW